MWAYLRDSGGDTQDLASQKAYLIAYCSHYKLNLVRIFQDAATSGGSVNHRDEFEAMIDEARKDNASQVVGILYWDLKRFARNQLDSVFFEADLERRGYKLVSLSDEIPDTSFAPVVKSLLRWKAEQDLKDISKDVKRGLQANIDLRDESGNYLGTAPGRAPLCYKSVPYDTGLKMNNGQNRIIGRWIPDPEMWERGKLAWTMRADRASLREIHAATQLYREIITPNILSNYSHFFRNYIYIGELHYAGKVYKNFVPPLVDLVTWQRVQELNYNRPKKGEPHPEGKLHPKTGRGPFLLSGLCRCLYCQQRMYGDVVTRGNFESAKPWRFYLCTLRKHHVEECESRRADASKLERVVIETVSSRVLTDKKATELLDSINAMLANKNMINSRIIQQEREVKELEQAVMNLIDMVEKYGSSRQLIERLSQREQELKLAVFELEQMQKQKQASGVRMDKSVIVAIVSNLNLTLNNGEIRVRQKLLQKTVGKIEVGRETFRIHCRFPVDTLGDWFNRPLGIQLNPYQIYEVSYA